MSKPNFTTQTLAEAIVEQIICREFENDFRSTGHDEPRQNMNLLGEIISHSFPLIVEGPHGFEKTFVITVSDDDAQ